jgi:hypothetical protein
MKEGYQGRKEEEGRKEGRKEGRYLRESVVAVCSDYEYVD